jgi:hypothetical protein
VVRPVVMAGGASCAGIVEGPTADITVNGIVLRGRAEFTTADGASTEVEVVIACESGVGSLGTAQVHIVVAEHCEKAAKHGEWS